MVEAYQVALFGLLLAQPEVVDDAGQDESGPSAMRRHHALVLQHVDEVLVAGVADEVVLTGGVDGQDLGPDGDEQRPEFPRGGLEKLEDVRKDADGQGQVDGPGPEVKEAAEEVEGSQAVRLRQQHLQDDGQLLRRRPSLVPVLQPDFKGLKIGKTGILAICTFFKRMTIRKLKFTGIKDRILYQDIAI